MNKNKLINYIWNAGVEPHLYYSVKDQLEKSSGHSISILSGFASIALLVMTIASFAIPDLAHFRIAYVSFLIPVVIVFVLSFKFWDIISKLRLGLTHIFLGILLLFGIMIGTVLGPTEITATYIALLLAAPQFFVDKPYRIHLTTILSVIIFIVLVIKVKDPVTWNSDITNAIIFGMVSMMLSTFSIVNKVSRVCMEETIRFMAENDQLTGLRNRNCYEKNLQRISILSAASVYCVYVDVNGLHELNNTKGHEAGDRMLQYVATVMQNLFGEDETYRIGGDEFVSLGIDKDEEMLRKKIEELKHAVEAAGYHVAVGMSFMPKKELQINDIIKNAESKMYKDKAAYYQKSGNDRRNR